MKKLLLLAALLALALVAAAPAIAQVSNEVGGNEAESGDVVNNFSATNSGNNSNQCATALQFGNTGNNQNAQGALQYGTTADDIEFAGGGFTFDPSNTQTCNQKVQQSAAASSY